MRRFWQPTDTFLLSAGAKGELLIARIRLLLTSLLLLIPLNAYASHPEARENYIGITVALASVAFALAVYIAVRREHHRPWLGFVTTVFDVTSVSAALAAFMVLDQPHTAVNSKVVFEAYFLAIGATALRYDVRTCFMAGALALAQYLGIVAYADAHWDLNSPAFAPYPYGMFDWGAQVSRLMLLFIAALLAATIVVRAHQLRRLSAIDRLTGLFNRGYFDERVEAELSRARRGQQPLSLVMLDIDHFKRFNDRYGHAAGDTALRTVASLVRNMVRRHDIVARYGGEEFVVVLPETATEAAGEKLEAIRAAVEAAAIRLPREHGSGSLTISAGVATFPADGVTTDDLLDEADARLFRAKEGGRNRVVGRTGMPSVSSSTSAPAAPPASPIARILPGSRRERV
jgi:diguanylate cyclase (GGDEF)-like protein